MSERNYAEYDDELDFQNEEMEEVETPEENDNFFYRFLAFALAIVPMILLLILPIKVLTYETAFAVESYSLIGLFGKLFSKNFSGDKLFDILPILTPDTRTLGILCSVMLYVIFASIIVCLIASIVACCSAKKAPGINRFILFV